MGVWASGASIVKRVGKRFDSNQRSDADGSALANHIRHRSRRVHSGWSDPTPRERRLSLRRRNHVFPNRAHLPWARGIPVQKLDSVSSVFSLSNNLGHLLFARRKTQEAPTDGVLEQNTVEEQGRSSPDSLRYTTVTFVGALVGPSAKAHARHADFSSKWI